MNSEKNALQRLTTTQIIGNSINLMIIQQDYAETLEMVAENPLQVILNAEKITRDIFTEIYRQEKKEIPADMDMKAIFLAIRKFVPTYIQIELENVGYAYHHAMHEPMIELSETSDFVIAGMEGLRIIYEWFEQSQGLSSSIKKELVMSAKKIKTVPIFSSNVKTIAIYEKKIKKNSADISAFVNRGILYNNVGKLMPAISDFSEALQLDATIAEIYLHRGNTYQLLGDYENAMADYQTALDLNLEKAELYHYRGLLFQKMDNFGQAMVNFDLALAIKPNYAEAKRNRKLLKKKNRLSVFNKKQSN